MDNSPAAAGAVLFAKDLLRTATFYERVFDVRVVRREADHVVLRSASFEVVVHAIPAHIAATFSIATPPERRDEAAVKLCLPVASLAEARSMATTCGGAIDPAEREWVYEGRRVCDGMDPEGNVVQAWEVTG